LKILKNHIWRTAIIVVLVDILIFLILKKKNEDDSFGMLSSFIEMGIALLIQLGIGIVAVIPLNMRKYGQGILLGTLIIGLIGLGMCTYSMI
jgi:hypothetical protein